MRTARRRVRFAVVGLGHLSQVAVLPAFAHAKASCELVALVSSDPKKLRVLGKRYGVEHLGPYEGLEELIQAAEVDAVYVATPNDSHREFTERSMAAGAHVLCEKPMAMSVEDCEAMNAAAKRFNRKLMIAYRLHFEEATLRAIDTVKSGKLGELRYFSSSFSHQIRRGDIRTKAAVGGGALADVRVLQAIAQSALTGMPVMLAPQPPKRRPNVNQALKRPPVRKPKLINVRSPSL